MYGSDKDKGGDLEATCGGLGGMKIHAKFSSGKSTGKHQCEELVFRGRIMLKLF
jgi:hypothetical protein